MSLPQETVAVAANNLNIKLMKELHFNNNFVLPISFQYIHNAATKNTELNGKNFLVVNVLLEL